MPNKLDTALNNFISRLKPDKNIRALLLEKTDGKPSAEILIITAKLHQNMIKHCLENGVEIKIRYCVIPQFKEKMTVYSPSRVIFMDRRQLICCIDENIQQLWNNRPEVPEKYKQVALLSRFGHLYDSMNKLEKSLVALQDSSLAYFYLSSHIPEALNSIILLIHNIRIKDSNTATSKAAALEPELYQLISSGSFDSELKTLLNIFNGIKQYMITQTELVFQPFIDYYLTREAELSMTEAAEEFLAGYPGGWFDLAWLEELGLLGLTTREIILSTKCTINQKEYYLKEEVLSWNL